MVSIIQVMYGSLIGVIAILFTSFLPEKFERMGSTLVSLAAYAVLFYLVVGDRSVSGLIGVTALVIGLASAIASWDIVEKDENKVFHDALTFALSSSAYLVVTTTDLLRLFILWEFMSITVAVLTAFHKKKESVEASLKYIMMCGTGSLLALAGIALVYLETGYTSFEFLNRASMLPKILLITGFGIEAAAFPLHFWLPDAHMAAPSTASAILSGITIETAAVVISRVASTEPLIQEILVVSALIGMFVGNISAYMQDDIKRLLAYSSVANVSYILLGLNIGNELAYRFSVVHIMAHGFLKASLFILSGLFIALYGTRKLSELVGVLSNTYIEKFVIVAAGLGLTGVPPFLTFWSEAFTLAGVFLANNVVAVIFAVAVLLSFGYYFKMFYSLSIRKPNREIKASKVSIVFASVLLVVLAILAGLIPSLIISYFNL